MPKRTNLQKYLKHFLLDNKLFLHPDDNNLQSIYHYKDGKLQKSLEFINQAIFQANNMHHIIHYQAAFFHYEFGILINDKNYIEKAIFFEHDILSKIDLKYDYIESHIIPQYANFIIFDCDYYKSFVPQDTSIPKNNYDIACEYIMNNDSKKALNLLEEFQQKKPYHFNAIYLIQKLKLKLAIINVNQFKTDYQNLLTNFNIFHEFYHENTAIYFYNRALIHLKLNNNLLAYNDLNNCLNLDRDLSCAQKLLKELTESIVN